MQVFEFRSFQKLHRLSRPVIVTEKIDGSNAQILISDDGKEIVAGSRKRWLTPEDDNFGFAKWVYIHQDELKEKLGPGRHYGEWWGNGIQRNYSQTRKRFSLFNVGRWTPENKPGCCDVVPVLAELAELNIFAIRKVLKELMAGGSVAAPGFMNPEGIVAFHTHSGVGFKMTPDDEAKGVDVNG